MLAIRLQRVGRKKLAQYRLIAQEHSVQPTSGKVAAYLGSYNPHTKESQLKKEDIEKYLNNGAQPSNSAAKLLKNQGIKLPDWVVIKTKEPKKSTQTEADAVETEEKPQVASSEDAGNVDTSEEKPAEDSKEQEPKKEAEATEAAKDAQPADKMVEETKEVVEEAAPAEEDQKPAAEEPTPEEPEEQKAQ